MLELYHAAAELLAAVEAVDRAAMSATFTCDDGTLLCAVDDAARLNPSAFGLWLKNEERARQRARRKAMERRP